MAQATLAEEAARKALRLACATLDSAEASGEPGALSLALAAVARGCRQLHELASAEAYYGQALRWARLQASVDHEVELLCELCETSAVLAAQQDRCRPASGYRARERARDRAFEASTLARRVADPAWEAPVLLRISEVLLRLGDHDDALALQTRALRLMTGGGAGANPDPARLPGLGRLADG